MCQGFRKTYRFRRLTARSGYDDRAVFRSLVSHVLRLHVPQRALWRVSACRPAALRTLNAALRTLKVITPYAQAAQRALVVAREKASNEAKSEFMSLMCHEVRTPLNGCLASAEMLLATALEVPLPPSPTALAPSTQTLTPIKSASRVCAV